MTPAASSEERSGYVSIQAQRCAIERHFRKILRCQSASKAHTVTITRGTQRFISTLLSGLSNSKTHTEPVFWVKSTTFRMVGQRQPTERLQMFSGKAQPRL